MKATTLPAVKCSISQMCDRQLPSPHPMLTPPLPLLLHTLLPPPVLLAVPQKAKHTPHSQGLCPVYSIRPEDSSQGLPLISSPTESSALERLSLATLSKGVPLVAVAVLPLIFFVALTYIMYRCIHLLAYYLAPPLDCEPEARHLVLFTAVSPMPSMGAQHPTDSVNIVKWVDGTCGLN